MSEIAYDGTPADALNTPSLAMVTVGLMFAAMNLLGLLTVGTQGVMMIGLGAAGLAAPGRPGMHDSLGSGVVIAEGLAFLVVGLVIDVLGLLGSGVVILAGARMRELRSYNLVQGGAFLAMAMPATSMFSTMCGGCGICGLVAWVPLLGLGLSAGLFALAAIRRPGVREAFTS